MTAPQKRNHPAGGFFFCVHFTPQSRLRLDGRSVSGLLLFTSTPQSIAKPSPGWNKVALLTAVRNSPCSCPFSVSLHPPQAALNSKPRKRWSIIVRFISLHIKPALKGEVANVVSRRGYKAAYSSLFITTPQSNLRFASSPFREPFEERISPHASARRVTQNLSSHLASHKKRR